MNDELKKLAAWLIAVDGPGSQSYSPALVDHIIERAHQAWDAHWAAQAVADFGIQDYEPIFTGEIPETPLWDAVVLAGNPGALAAPGTDEPLTFVTYPTCPEEISDGE